MKCIYQTWKVPWVELINVESGDDKVEVGPVIFKLVPKIERNKLFFSWIEAEAWWLWLHLLLSFSFFVGLLYLMLFMSDMWL